MSRHLPLLPAIILCSLAISVVGDRLYGISPGQRDNFQAPGVANWTVGNWDSHPSPPVRIVNGGPLGPGDHYLQIEGSGSTGAGSKPTTFNPAQWSGDYTLAGITAIGMEVKYMGQGPEHLNLRLALQSPAGVVWTTEFVTVRPGTQFPWEYVEFPITTTSLVGGDATVVLQDVQKLWLHHGPTSAAPTSSPALDVRIGYDNIIALPIPIPGDANLDRVVNDTDFVIWREHAFTESGLWTDGDFNRDGYVDGYDFDIWLDNRGVSEPLPQQIPEPYGVALLTSLAVFWRRLSPM